MSEAAARVEEENQTVGSRLVLYDDRRSGIGALPPWSLSLETGARSKPRQNLQTVAVLDGPWVPSF